MEPKTEEEKEAERQGQIEEIDQEYKLWIWLDMEVDSPDDYYPDDRDQT